MYACVLLPVGECSVLVPCMCTCSLITNEYGHLWFEDVPQGLLARVYVCVCVCVCVCVFLLTVCGLDFASDDVIDDVLQRSIDGGIFPLEKLRSTLEYLPFCLE